MRKRSKYRPKPQFANPLQAVLEKIAPVASHGSYLLDLKIKNHGAMTALMQGKAERVDLDALLAMNNIMEAFWQLAVQPDIAERIGFVREHEGVVQAGYQAVKAVGQRFAQSGRATPWAAEIAALNDYMLLHDVVMDAIVVDDMDKAIAHARKVMATGQAERITGRTIK